MALLDPMWAITANPAANAIASASHAAVPGKSHVCNTIHCTLSSNAVLAAAINVSFIVRDGASGVGAVLWSSSLSLPNTPGTASAPISMSGLAITGTLGNAFTVEFSAAAGAGTFETVSATGFTT
jgi:hypothetical protein